VQGCCIQLQAARATPCPHARPLVDPMHHYILQQALAETLLLQQQAGLVCKQTATVATMSGVLHNCSLMHKLGHRAANICDASLCWSPSSPKATVSKNRAAQQCCRLQAAIRVQVWA
jgi:hypothetical protein